MRRMIWRIVLIVSGALLVADSIFACMLSNINLGIVMPFVIGLPLLATGLFYGILQPWWQTAAFGKFIKWGTICAYSLFGLLFATTTTLILINSDDVKDNEKADAVIVLGAGLNGDAPTVVLTNRLKRALEYHESYPDTVIIVSGGKSETEICSEASVMKRWLVERGVPEELVIEEDRSVSTQQNFMFSNEIVQGRFKDDVRLAFITTRFHVFRAEKIAEKQGIEAFGIASADFWPLALNNYLRECAAITQYLITGKI